MGPAMTNLDIIQKAQEAFIGAAEILSVQNGDDVQKLVNYIRKK